MNAATPQGLDPINTLFTLKSICLSIGIHNAILPISNATTWEKVGLCEISRFIVEWPWRINMVADLGYTIEPRGLLVVLPVGKMEYAAFIRIHGFQRWSVMSRRDFVTLSMNHMVSNGSSLCLYRNPATMQKNWLNLSTLQLTQFVPCLLSSAVYYLYWLSLLRINVEYIYFNLFTIS